jgi:hypothetical protein
LGIWDVEIEIDTTNNYVHRRWLIQIPNTKNQGTGCIPYCILLIRSGPGGQLEEQQKKRNLGVGKRNGVRSSESGSGCDEADRDISSADDFNFYL